MGNDTRKVKILLYKSITILMLLIFIPFNLWLEGRGQKM
nr:MAG TPA: hypothetical protein [Caudoviricetes sp.]